VKTLIVLAHPDLSRSKVNRRWVYEAEKYPDNFTIHCLYDEYPLKQINTEKERALIETHGSLILQFPLYWSNCPPLMKQWLDEVFIHGWAYGSKADKMRNRKVALAVSAGTSEKEYKERFNVSFQQILLPFEITFKYMNADFQGFHILSGLEHDVSIEKIESSVDQYTTFIRHI
jgi:putative NADPH-quinone reductase